MMIWYLVMGNLYLGPLTENQCREAEVKLKEKGAVCMKADYLYYCQVEGKPGFGTTCPHFTFPEIKLKESVQ